jgi:hypothetical protein
MFRPLPLFTLATGTAIAVIGSAYVVRTPECSARGPRWFDVVFFTLGPISIAAVFAAVVAYGIRERLHPAGWLLAATGVAAIWGVVGLIVAVGILLPNGCLSAPPPI